MTILIQYRTSDKGHSERGQTSQQRIIKKELLYIHFYTKESLKEDNLSKREKRLGLKCVYYLDVPL